MYTLNFVQKELRKYKNKKIVLVGGSFDILHIEHVRFLKKAKKLGDILVVGINSDAHIKLKKDINRPIISENQRAEILNSLKDVDYVFITDKKLYDFYNLEKIKPNVLVLGKEKNRKECVKKIIQLFPNLKIFFITNKFTIHTSKIIKKIIFQGKNIH